jgi:hypothetical protein
VHESDNPHNGHVSVGTSLYRCAGLPLYSWPCRNIIMFIPFFIDFRMLEWRDMRIVLVWAPRGFCFEHEAYVQIGVVM